MQLKYVTMSTNIIILVLIVSIIWYFYYRIRENQKKKELLARKLAYVKIKKIEIPEKIEKKKEIFYELNTHPIKLSLYSKSCFHNYGLARIYQNIVVKTYWLNEPFHSEFSKLLQFIGSNNLWIRDPKTREIIINVRDNNNKLSKKISMTVLSLSEVLEDTLNELILYLKRQNIYAQYDIQNAILSASIYILSQSGEIDIISKTLGIIYSDQEGLQSALIEKICGDISSETKNNLIYNDYLNSIPIKEIYNQILFDSKQYPYTFSVDNPTTPVIKLLSYLPKKQLISIC